MQERTHSLYQIVFDNICQASLHAIPAPAENLGPKQLRGRTLYSAISPGTEMNVYLGNYEKEGLAWGRLPHVPGYACVFEVTDVGSEVNDILPGAYVFSMGRHESIQLAERDSVLPLPEKLNPRYAPCARLMNVTMTTLSTTLATPPARVVVMGLGPIGLLGAAIFKRCGFRVCGIDPIAERRAFARTLGLQVAETDEERAPWLGKSALVLECSSHEQAMLDGLQFLRQKGELVLVGVPMVQRADVQLQKFANAIFRRQAVVRSGSEWEVPMRNTAYRPNSIWEQMEAALQWMAEGSVEVEPLLGFVSPRDPQAVFQDVLARKRKELITCFDWSLI